MKKIITGIETQADFTEQNYLPVFSSSFEKHASDIYVPSKIVDYIKKLKPRPDGRYIHIIALGTGEYWGPNRKSDYFPEWSLLGTPPPPDVQAILTKRGVVIPEHYGLSTFENFGYSFRNHANQDPSLTIGGRVPCAAYNDKMKRVELIVFISKDKAPDLVQRIDDNEPIPWSMGCKVNFDVCSVCGHMAPTVNNYCEHARDHLGEVRDDGTRVYVSNWFPKFFDISAVIVPADRAAWSLRKVASDINRPAHIDMGRILNRQAILSKTGSIIKETPTEVPDQENLGSNPIPKRVFQKAKHLVGKDKIRHIKPEALKSLKHTFGVPTTLRSLTASGIILRPPEARCILGNSPMPHMGRVLHDGSNSITPFMQRLIPNRSMFNPHISKRVIHITIELPSGDGIGKTATFDQNVQDYYKWLATLSTTELVKGKFHADINPEDYIASFQYKLANINREDNFSQFMDWEFIAPFVIELNKYL